MSTEVLNEVIAFEKWWKEHEGLHRQSRYDVALGVWMAGMSTRRQLEIAVEALKYIDQYNRQSANPNSFTVGDRLNMRGEAGLALDSIKEIGPKIE